MLKAVIDVEKCNQSKNCFEKCIATVECEKKAIFKLEPEDNAMVDTSLCNGCGLCLHICPARAVSVKEF